jgi:hypothetical protein
MGGSTGAVMSNSIVSPRPVLAGGDISASAVSWPAIFAGAVVASAVSLALLALGAGLELISVSPWSMNNMSVTTFGILAAAWLIAVQLFSSGVGGYLAGRLRTRWTSAHTDEVYFRDTAHGFLVWAVGALISVLLLTSAAVSIASGAVHAGAAAMGAGAAGGPLRQSISDQSNPTAYYTDMLFRSDRPASSGDAAASQAEIGRILSRAVASGGDVSGPDRTYIAQVVASRTGLSQAEAEKRVSDVVGQAQKAAADALDTAKKAAESARKTGVYVSLWGFISLLVGAFSASYMATIGGRLRDDLPASG